MLIPRPYHVMVSPFYDSDKTQSGLLYVPDTAKGRSNQGIVKYVGRDCKFISPMDYVLFNGWDGETITFPDEEQLIDLHEKQIAGIITNAEFTKITVNGLYYKTTAIDGNPYERIPLTEAMMLIKRAIRDNFPEDFTVEHKQDMHHYNRSTPEQLMELKYAKGVEEDSL